MSVETQSQPILTEMDPLNPSNSTTGIYGVSAPTPKGQSKSPECGQTKVLPAFVLPKNVLRNSLQSFFDCPFIAFLAAASQHLFKTPLRAPLSPNPSPHSPILSLPFRQSPPHVSMNFSFLRRISRRIYKLLFSKMSAMTTNFHSVVVNPNGVVECMCLGIPRSLLMDHWKSTVRAALGGYKLTGSVKGLLKRFSLNLRRLAKVLHAPSSAEQILLFTFGRKSISNPDVVSAAVANTTRNILRAYGGRDVVFLHLSPGAGVCTECGGLSRADVLSSAPQSSATDLSRQHYSLYAHPHPTTTPQPEVCVSHDTAICSCGATSGAQKQASMLSKYYGYDRLESKALSKNPSERLLDVVALSSVSSSHILPGNMLVYALTAQAASQFTIPKSISDYTHVESAKPGLFARKPSKAVHMTIEQPLKKISTRRISQGSMADPTLLGLKDLPVCSSARLCKKGKEGSEYDTWATVGIERTTSSDACVRYQTDQATGISKSSAITVAPGTALKRSVRCGKYVNVCVGAYSDGCGVFTARMIDTKPRGKRESKVTFSDDLNHGDEEDSSSVCPCDSPQLLLQPAPSSISQQCYRTPNDPSYFKCEGVLLFDTEVTRKRIKKRLSRRAVSLPFKTSPAVHMRLRKTLKYERKIRKNILGSRSYISINCLHVDSSSSNASLLRSSLLNKLTSMAASLSMPVCVCAYNESAVSFYKTHGFTVMHTQRIGKSSLTQFTMIKC
ncbi:hypothetical protein ADUPG1_007061 [Aduncisulcus paluster]|uniref:N-acetyltransferase domain-containing protein n=1 Tax=Aduncisulcus paluster TaxID=2918883 RepID=A0ABQ5KKK9_9EUKA|nr:hypothetical protein ADUPG1_007061 [Aduncisulcus paluster]